MNKKLAKKIEDFPLTEVLIVTFIILFLTLAVINVLMGGTLIDKDLIDKVLDNVVKAF